jgi:pimeloyl-ACP methyl ester carboxylesterase
VAIVPATDWAALHQFWTDGVAAGMGPPGAEGFWMQVIDLIETATGGTPAMVPDAYRARSPLHFGAELDAFTGPLLIVSGAEDWATPPPQQCAMAAAIPGVRAHHVLDADGNIAATAPPGCEASGLTWSPGPHPAGSWTDPRYLLVYDGAGHVPAMGDPISDRMIQDIGTFLLSGMPP